MYKTQITSQNNEIKDDMKENKKTQIIITDKTIKTKLITKATKVDKNKK